MTERLVAAGIGGSSSSLLLLGLMVLMIVWMVVGQRRRARQTQQLQDSLTDGDEVVSAAGLFGVLRGVADRRAYVEIAPGVIVELDRRQIVPVPEHLRKQAPQPPAETPEPQTPEARDINPPQEQ